MTLNGVDVPVAADSLTSTVKDDGEAAAGRRGINGGLYVDRLYSRRQFAFKTLPMAPADAAALLAVIDGRGVSIPFDDARCPANNYIAPMAGTECWQSDRTADGAYVDGDAMRGGFVWPSRATENLLTPDQAEGVVDNWNRDGNHVATVSDPRASGDGALMLDVADDPGASVSAAVSTIYYASDVTFSGLCRLGGYADPTLLQAQLDVVDGDGQTQSFATDIYAMRDRWVRWSVHTGPPGYMADVTASLRVTGLYAAAAFDELMVQASYYGNPSGGRWTPLSYSSSGLWYDMPSLGMLGGAGGMTLMLWLTQPVGDGPIVQVDAGDGTPAVTVYNHGSYGSSLTLEFMGQLSPALPVTWLPGYNHLAVVAAPAVRYGTEPQAVCYLNGAPVLGTTDQVEGVDFAALRRLLLPPANARIDSVVAYPYPLDAQRLAAQMWAYGATSPLPYLQLTGDAVGGGPMLVSARVTRSNFVAGWHQGGAWVPGARELEITLEEH